MHRETSGLGMCPRVAVTQLLKVISALKVLVYPLNSLSERRGGFFPTPNLVEEPMRMPQSRARVIERCICVSSRIELTCVVYGQR